MKAGISAGSKMTDAENTGHKKTEQLGVLNASCSVYNKLIPSIIPT